MSKVFLDANILYSNTTRSLFIWLHKNGVIEIYWSIDVWEEVFQALKRNQPNDETRIRLALTEKVIAAYPECLVQTPKFDAIGLQDPKDEHVVHSAKACNADYLITNDVVLLNDPVANQSLSLTDADTFLTEVLAKHSPLTLTQSVYDHLANLIKSKPSVSAYVQSLRKSKLEKFADWIEQRNRLRKLFVEVWPS